MKLEQALSLSLNREISAEQADRLYAQGILLSKHLFECPGPNCHAQVTCANLDKPRRLRKREPYFKFVSEHAQGCPLEEQSDEEFRRIQNSKTDPEALPFIREDIVDLDLSAPNKRVTHDILATEKDKDSTKRGKRADKEDDDENSKRRHSRKRLSGLVEAFIAKENLILNTVEGNLHLRDFFIKISDKKNLDEYLDEPRVYFGKAWLYIKKNYYLVRFDNEMRIGKLKCKPSFFIPERLVDHSDYQRTSRETLNKIAMAKPLKPLYLFIFSELPPVKKNDGDYINFKLDNLIHLYFLKWGQK
ncbi:hypothetical protein [Sodalis sp. dw_96]|uniref:hypothetical protein n=1 Tax=Sodalis sp. dw_96 TaxID=2719794 RepID=UPI001BD2455E|nr:hypothetical protein [Sodalis sp. dw_96]